MATIIIKNSTGSGAVPSSLQQGELAINTIDGKLFYGSGSGNVVKEFTGSGGGGGSTNTGSLLTTASFSNPNLTFTKGDNSTFNVNLNTLVPTSASYASTASYVSTASYAANGGVTQLLAGPNITLSPTTGVGQVTISSTAGGGGFNTATGSYGSFYDTTTQTNPVANVPRSMSFNSTDITNGVSISGSTDPFNTYVKTENAGIYNIQFSAQVDKTDGGTDDIVIWLRKNGIDLTDTATTLTLPTNNSKVVAAWNWFVTSAAGDYYQIIWLSADTDLRLFAEPITGTHPGIPSVILTANRVDQFLSNTGSFSGSFTGVFTGSLFGTASWATNAISSSYALTASFVQTAQTASYVLNAVSSSFASTASFVQSSSYALNATSASFASTASYLNTLNQNLTFNGNLTLNGTASISTLVVNQTQYSSGSNQLGDAANDTQTLYGTVVIPTGSLTVSGNVSFGTSSAGFYWDNTNGYLGIKKTNPAVEIDVVGSIRATSTVFNSTTQTQNIQINSGVSTLRFLSGSVETARYDGNNWGFYTTAPTARLHIKGAGATSATTAFRVENTNASASLVVLDNGNVGIGTTTPSQTLTVNGNISASGDLFINTGSNQIRIGDGIVDDVFTDTFKLYNVGINGFLGTYFYNSSLELKAGASGSSFVSNWSKIEIKDNFSSTGYIRFFTSGSERARITNAGNFGIGTTSPSSTLDVSGSARITNGLTVTGSLIATSFTGSLLGTASWANNAITASYVLNAVSSSFATSASFASTASFVQNAQTASYILNAVSASFASTASYVLNAVSSSFASTASFVQNAQTASYVLQAVSASFATLAQTANTASYVVTAQTASYILNAVSASFASTASFVATASWALNALTASFVNTASTNAFVQGGNSFGATALLGTNDNQSLAFETSGSVRMFVSSSGNVGIGTIVPTASLHISASNSSSAFSFLVQNSSGQTLISSQNNRTVNINSTNAVDGDTTIGTTSGTITFNRGYNNTLLRNALTFYGGGDISTIQGWSSPTSGVAVGYAQTNINPVTGSVFTVKGTATTSGSGVLFVTGSSATRLLTVASEVSSSILVVSGSGNIGVGTNNPSANIHIVNSSSAAFRLQNVGGSSADFSISAGNSRFELVGNGASSGRITILQGAKYVGINQQTPTAAFHIVGAGATSATTSFLVQNSTPTTLFQIQDHGSSSFAGNMSITGSVRITGSAGLTVIGSGSTVLDIQGSQGQLFSITDSLTGSLFSVNDISGLPILEVFSDNTTLIGDYQDPMLITTKKVTMTNSGSFVVYSLPTASYDTAFFDYSIKSGSNARAGQIMAIQSGASVNFTETTTTDFGNTTAVSFTVIVSGSNMVLTGSAATGSWTIKSIIRGL